MKIKKLKYAKNDRRNRHILSVPNIPLIQQYFNSKQATFTKSMKNISNAIIRHPDILRNNLLVNFSKTLDLGEASVMRFCKHLGFRGFTEFKKYFVDNFFESPSEETKKASIVDLEVSEESTIEDILGKVSNTIWRNLLETKQSLAQSHDNIRIVADKIYHAQRVFVYGHSSNRAMIEETAARLNMIGIPAIGSYELSDMINKAALMTKGDVAIAISANGYIAETIKVQNLLSKHRVYTVAITADERSDVSMSAIKIFKCYGTYDKELGLELDSIYVGISQRFIIETLCNVIVSLNTSRLSDHRLNVRNNLNQVASSKDDQPTII